MDAYENAILIGTYLEYENEIYNFFEDATRYYMDDCIPCTFVVDRNPFQNSQ